MHAWTEAVFYDPAMPPHMTDPAVLPLLPTVSRHTQAKAAARKAQREWLDRVVAATNKTLSKLAAEIGRPGTTLTRFYNDPNYTGTLSPMIVQALSELTGLPGPGAAMEASKEALREEGVLIDIGADGNAAALAALIDGKPSASLYLINTSILRLAGVSDGDIMIIDRDLEPRNGDIVCASIDTSKGPRTVFRLYQRPVIMGASFDPNEVKPETVDGDRVKIIGVMTAMLRKRPTD